MSDYGYPDLVEGTINGKTRGDRGAQNKVVEEEVLSDEDEEEDDTILEPFLVEVWERELKQDIEDFWYGRLQEYHAMQQEKIRMDYMQQELCLKKIDHE